MNWELIEDTGKHRKYIQKKTGSECETQLIYTDATGRDWWGFVDLFKMPFIRIAFSQQIANLFATGISVEDWEKWDNEEKALCKSSDPEKYEKIYSIILEREKARKSIVDPIKQNLALCTVYVLQTGERIDYFDNRQATEKMNLWQMDTDSASFFLNWHLKRIKPYIDSLNTISQIASNLKK